NAPPRASHVETLNAAAFRKLPATDACQHPLRFLDDEFKPVHQLLFRKRTTFSKLGGTITNVRCPAEAGHDPLPQGAAQMQDQVADAVKTRLEGPTHLPARPLTQPRDHPRPSTLP